jgi:hypothetical protein
MSLKARDRAGADAGGVFLPVRKTRDAESGRFPIWGGVVRIAAVGMVGVTVGVTFDFFLRGRTMHEHRRLRAGVPSHRKPYATH